MRVVALGGVLILFLAGCASSGGTDLVEQGFERGSLGVAAISRRDWAAAERGLAKHRGLASENPARLINLGTVYMNTGRTAQALSAWRLALASDRHEMVETAGGGWVSTKILAEQAIALHERKGQQASR